ncbi:outer membrane protein transport protein [Parasalinivibrio latis]|uniref:outer membrane protein transport protein n=1 Tax=Parasalinivibrio latis TaxID=2952610 RepID=UPI0030DE1600
MQNNKKLTIAIAVALGTLSTPAFSAGFQLAEYSATGLGRAFAGEAAMADNASAQFRNPAMMTYLEGTQISVGGIYVSPNIDIEGTNTTLNKATSAKNMANGALVPNFYLTHQFNEKWTAGFAVGTNFGMSTKLDDSFLGTQFGNEASITTVEVNPNIAYKINDQFSVGGGVRFVMGEGSIGATNSMDNALGFVPKGTTLKYMEGDDTAWGWQAGAAWQLNENNRVGFNYRSEVDLNLEGHANGFGFNPHNPAQKFAGSMELVLPASAELASFHQLNKQWALHTSINWTDWSQFEKLEAHIPALSKPNQLVKQENWKDSYRFAVGTTYQLDSKTQLRTGFAWDRSAVSDANRTLTIPEMDRYWFSVGYGYQFTQNLTLDAGVTYILGNKSDVKEARDNIPSDEQAEMFGGEFKGTVSGDIWLAGVQASYRF